MAALLPVHGYSLGLGELELNSALNQELNAEIEVLSAASSDAEQIIIKLAGRDAFIRAGLDRPFLLQQLKFKIIDKNGKPYVKVYTKTPVREPFLSFLLEIDWPQGHLLREYTLLLDPPVYNTGNTTGAAPANTSGSFNKPADTQAQDQPVYTEQQTQPVQNSAQTTPEAQTGVISSGTGRSVNYQYQSLPVATSSQDQYRVQQNDTLWSVASRMRPDNSISVEQMMLALVKRNPEAFIQENINGIKRGYILRIPKRDEITQLDRQQAVAQARDHAALWREYSQGVASASPASSMEADDMVGTTAADQPRDADGHLSIKGASDTGSEFAGTNQDPDARLNELKQELTMAREQLESERLEKEDLRSRLAELEQRVQRVIEMDDNELARLQQDLQTTQQAEVPAGAPVEEAIPEEAITEESAVEAMPEEQVSEEIMTETMPAEDMAEESMDEPVDELAETTPGEEAIFVDEAESDVMTDELAEDQPSAQMPEPVEPVEAIEAPAFVQSKPKGFFESLMEDPKLLGMIGGGLAFVLLLVALLLKRIRGNKAEEEEQWSSAMDDSSSDMLDLGGDFESSDLGMDEATVKTEAVDMDSTSEMLTEPLDEDITRVKMPTKDDDLKDTVFSLNDEEPEAVESEADDVIAETDVYLAYGIYQQAEELLKNAINQNPERDDYRMKLLETHFASKNAGGFEQLAQDVKSRKGDDKTYWDRVVAMGMELCPGSPLFSGTDSTLADFDPDALLPGKPQATDLELDAGAVEETDFDLGLDAVEEDKGETQVLSEPLDLGEMESLDDDLDLAGDLEGLTNEIDEETVEDAPLEVDTSSELEFDLGEIEDIEDVVDESTSDAPDDSADMDIDDDFSLDFDAADLGFEESEDDGDTEEISMDADLDLGVDLDAPTDESVEIDLDDGLDADLGDIEIDGDELDLGDMDIGDMDLGTDLDDSADIAEEEMDIGLDVSSEELDDDEFDISELSEEVDEVSTKLDLAKAYLDMGDNDGARSILEEVKVEGNNEQQQQAEELLQKAS